LSIRANGPPRLGSVNRVRATGACPPSRGPRALYTPETESGELSAQTRSCRTPRLIDRRASRTQRDAAEWIGERAVCDPTRWPLRWSPSRESVFLLNRNRPALCAIQQPPGVLYTGEQIGLQVTWAQRQFIPALLGDVRAPVHVGKTHVHGAAPQRPITQRPKMPWKSRSRSGLVTATLAGSSAGTHPGGASRRVT
jgi:hypothetical protein